MAFTIENNVLLKYYAEFGCKELTIPDNIKEIAPDAFIEADELETVSIPDSIQIIPSGIFWNCNALKFIKIYKGDISVTIELSRIYYFGQIISFVCSETVEEKEQAFRRMTRGDLCLPAAVFLALAHNSEIGKKFIRLNTLAVLNYLTDTDDIANIKAVLELGYAEKEELSQAVDHAISRNSLEIQIVLSSYKNENFGSDISSELEL